MSIFMTNICIYSHSNDLNSDEHYHICDPLNKQISERLSFWNISNSCQTTVHSRAGLEIEGWSGFVPLRPRASDPI